ncbi:MAG: ABC transporter substrate-binding protein [Rhodospirillaceae bacterium]|nr:ABC transporter substrate-binding protein [Rhodospirillaceae bacterium]
MKSFTRREFNVLAAAAGASALTPVTASVASAQEIKPVHAIAMHGKPKYPAGFKHFDYTDPTAPKGGKVLLEAFGTYDSFNPFILKGQAASGIGLLYDNLASSSSDEAFTKYGSLAESITMPDDRAWVAFNLHPDARWHDGKPVTVEDVIWTFEALTTKGHPFYRAYYGEVNKPEKTGARQVTFRFKGSTNRELPLIVAELTVLPKHWWESREFGKTTLEPPLGSGAYRLKEFEAGRSIVYERVADYWGKDLAVHRGTNNIDELRYEYYRDREVATEAFKGGAFDFRSENSSKRWATAFDFPALTKGAVIKEEVPQENPTGMQGFAFNTRRAMFKDPKVRQALAHAWDFEWSNKTLMYDAYTRTNSYFSNSELASSGLPTGAELKILETFKGQVPDEVFTTEYQAPKTDGSGNNRRNLRKALKLLGEAGWVVKDRKLRNAAGEAMAFETLLVSPAFERLVLPFKKNLERLGVDMSVRTVDTAQYQRRLDDFDFDVVVSGFGQSLSPGNEQRDYWHSSKVDVQGSRNVMGIADPVVDQLIEMVIQAPDRESLITRTRALDRVLLWGHYVIPHFHIRVARIIYWNKFGRPKQLAKYSTGFPTTWWIDPEKEAAVKTWRKKSKS